MLLSKEEIEKKLSGDQTEKIGSMITQMLNTRKSGKSKIKIEIEFSE